MYLQKIDFDTAEDEPCKVSCNAVLLNWQFPRAYLVALRTALQAAKEEADSATAIRLLELARRDGVAADETCVRAALVACARSRRWDQQWLHGIAANGGFRWTTC